MRKTKPVEVDKNQLVFSFMEEKTGFSKHRNLLKELLDESIYKFTLNPKVFFINIPDWRETWII